MLAIASQEAEKAFSDGTVYLEKYLENPRHVEIQIVADHKGSVVHLGERDCTVQQNHQKLIEESPSPVVTSALRSEDGRGRRASPPGAGIHGSGHRRVPRQGRQALLHGSQRARPGRAPCLGNGDRRGHHPPAAARRKRRSPWRSRQDEVRLGAYAVECRINARSAGRVTQFTSPGGFGVRMDTFLLPRLPRAPVVRSPRGKAHRHRAERAWKALRRMERALSELVIEGIATNIESQKKILAHPRFRSGDYGTGFLGEVLKEGGL